VTHPCLSLAYLAGKENPARVSPILSRWAKAFWVFHKVMFGWSVGVKRSKYLCKIKVWKIIQASSEKYCLDDQFAYYFYTRFSLLQSEKQNRPCGHTFFWQVSSSSSCLHLSSQGRRQELEIGGHISFHLHIKSFQIRIFSLNRISTWTNGLKETMSCFFLFISCNRKEDFTIWDTDQVIRLNK